MIRTHMSGALVVDNKYDPTRKRLRKQIKKHGKVKGRKLSKKQERFLYAQVARPPND